MLLAITRYYSNLGFSFEKDGLKLVLQVYIMTVIDTRRPPLFTISVKLF